MLCAPPAAALPSGCLQRATATAAPPGHTQAAAPQQNSRSLAGGNACCGSWLRLAVGPAPAAPAWTCCGLQRLAVPAGAWTNASHRQRRRGQCPVAAVSGVLGTGQPARCINSCVHASVRLTRYSSSGLPACLLPMCLQARPGPRAAWPCIASQSTPCRRAAAQRSRRLRRRCGFMRRRQLRRQGQVEAAQAQLQGGAALRPISCSVRWLQESLLWRTWWQRRQLSWSRVVS